ACRGFRRGEGEVACGMRDAAVEEIKARAVAEIFCALDDGAVTKANGLRCQLLELEAMLTPAVIDAIATFAMAQQFHLVHPPLDLDSQRNRKRRGQRPAAAPGSRMGMGDSEQQRRKRGIR